jgi:hypothetical protein
MIGLLRKTLTFPVTGATSGVVWIARQIAEAADAQMNDPAVLREALVAAEAQLLAGELSEEEYDAIEDDLLERMGAIGP